MSTVALLAEGVDRNSTISIEFGSVMNVALLAEGVDRNFSAILAWISASCRPPRGGRG